MSARERKAVAEALCSHADAFAQAADELDVAILDIETGSVGVDVSPLYRTAHCLRALIAGLRLDAADERGNIIAPTEPAPEVALRLVKAPS